MYWGLCHILTVVCSVFVQLVQITVCIIYSFTSDLAPIPCVCYWASSECCVRCRSGTHRLSCVQRRDPDRAWGGKSADWRTGVGFASEVAHQSGPERLAWRLSDSPFGWPRPAPRSTDPSSPADGRIVVPSLTLVVRPRCPVDSRFVYIPQFRWEKSPSTPILSCGILSCEILSVGILSCGILSHGILSGYHDNARGAWLKRDVVKRKGRRVFVWVHWETKQTKRLYIIIRQNHQTDNTMDHGIRRKTNMSFLTRLVLRLTKVGWHVCRGTTQVVLGRAFIGFFSCG